MSTIKPAIHRTALLIIVLVVSTGLLSCNLLNLLKKTASPPPASPSPLQPSSEPETAPDLSPTVEIEPQVEVLDYLYNQDFSSDYSEWGLSPYKGEAVEVEYEIDDGVFVWNVEARDDSTLMNIPDPSVWLPDGDFLATASIQIRSEDNPISAGLLFRVQDVNNLYFAKLSQEGDYSVYALENDQWEAIVEPGKSHHFQPGKANRLSVIEQNGKYEVQVNDYPVVTFTDDRFQGGKLGLIVELDGGMKGKFSFDDVRIMEPGTSAVEIDEEPQALPTMVDLGGAMGTYYGDHKGAVKYEMDVFMNFIHSTAGGWQRFCLEGSEDLCVSIQPQNGNWDGPEDMANEVITGFSSTVGDYQELSHDSIYTDEGLPAYWVEYTYHWEDQDLKAMRMFVNIQHVGFDITADGTPAMMDVYQDVMEKMMKSFRLPSYN